MCSPLFGKDLDTLREVTVDVDGKQETVFMDPVKGPILYVKDGSMGRMKVEFHKIGFVRPFIGWRSMVRKTWQGYSSSEQETLVRIVAKRNMRLKEQVPELEALQASWWAEYQARLPPPPEEAAPPPAELQDAQLSEGVELE
mmetsp:Transcript_37077/g.106041  ORF Transcript_37077/g.106041 Transcript_37077/m.106041 type:complete len:142 (-) Transcript_37077:71-496(-)